ncbi:MAG: hypothetical protein KDA84_29315, partial [Planctomycetaceae bacterium]|nr:hypothetical protein [Planctomycetaceae bacterium]
MRVALVVGCLGGSCLLSVAGHVFAADGLPVRGTLNHSATWEISRTQQAWLREAEHQLKLGKLSDAFLTLQRVLDENPVFVSRGQGLENSQPRFCFPWAGVGEQP